MTIAFVHPHKAFLPEIEAYTDFFSGHGIKTMVVHPKDINKINADVEWHFMGSHSFRKKNKITIHEYASASMPPFSLIKDRIKKYINAVPDYRIFNNEYVKQQFQFNDSAPSGIRDYGININTDFAETPSEKLYDFVYVGSTDKTRKINKLFDHFTKGDFQNYSLLVVSKEYQNIAKELETFTNIHFTGPVTLHEINKFIMQAKHAINYIPDIIPYNQQTSAKLLDYLNCRMPVITTDYKWVKDFQKKEGGNFFYLDDDLENFTWENISSFNYSFPDLKNWSWENQIRKSGVLNFLNIV
jgi:Glycosyl transferases group 1